MSEWYEADDEDIDVVLAMEEVNIYAGWDGDDSIYVTLTFDQIESIWKSIQEEQ